jgi:trehalose 6-phosphate phosphatase
VERRDAAGRVHRGPVDAEQLRRAASRIRDFARQHEGLVFEDKGYSVALHYRRAPRLRESAEEVVLAAAAGLGGAFEAQNGKMVIELKPAGRDKGMAIREFMLEPPFVGRVPVFIGDDVTDEHGFRVVNRLKGHSVKVGEGATAARWRVKDAAALRVWLAQWLRMRSAAA